MRKLLVALVVVLVAIAIGAAVFLKKNFVVEAAEVERIAARLLPGARPPKGSKGVLALKPDDLEIAVLAAGLPQVKVENLEAGQLRIIVARPQSDSPPQPSEIIAKISQMQKDRGKAVETLSKKPVALQIGGKAYPAMESKLKVREGGLLLREDFTILLVDKHPVVVLLTGPEENYPEEARNQFLSGLTAPEGPPHPDLPSGLASPLAHPPALPVIAKPRPPSPPGLKPPVLSGALSRPSRPEPKMPRPSFRKPHPPRPSRPSLPGPPGSDGPPGPIGF